VTGRGFAPRLVGADWLVPCPCPFRTIGGVRVDTSRPGLLRAQSFEEAVDSALGVRLTVSQHRLRAPWWVRELETDLPCPNCATDLEVFRCLQRLRSGGWRELLAAVCSECEDAWLPDELTPVYSRAIKALAMWSQAVDDVDEVA
jgi:hypothetical protein